MQNDIPKKPRPDAGCIRCGKAYSGPPHRTVMCVRPDPVGWPCGGRIIWRLNPDDWRECQACSGTGVREERACQRCGGEGWLMGKQ